MSQQYEANQGGSNRLAGVPLVELNGEPWQHPDEDLRSPAEELVHRHETAEWILRQYGMVVDASDNGNEDCMASVTLHGSGDYTGLRYRFYLTRSLVDRFAAAEAAALDDGHGLSQTEMLKIALGDTEGTVNPEFTADAPNVINASFYRSRLALQHGARPAQLFVNNEPLNFALGGLLADRTGVQGRPIRVKELSSGGNAAHWRHAAQGAVAQGASGLSLTLTDFAAPPAVPAATGPELALDSEAYSLLDDLPELPAEERFDAIIGEYSFDSVWQPEDMYVVWANGEPYRELYRLKVLDSHPRREELLAALRSGQPLQLFGSTDYSGIYVETALEPLDLSTHPYGAYIARMQGRPGSANFPGGLIKRVVQAFEGQLTPDGVFVSVDIADIGRDGNPDPIPSVLTSGAAARYKGENYWLARQILQEVHGFRVELLGFPELADAYLPAEVAAASPAAQVRFVHDDREHVALVVKRFESVDRAPAQNIGGAAVGNV